MRILNEIVKVIREAKGNMELVGKEMNPKQLDQQGKAFGPGDMITYFNNRSVEDCVVSDVVVKRSRGIVTEEDVTLPIRSTRVTTDVEWVEEVTRMELGTVGFLNANIVEYDMEDDIKTIQIVLESGAITPIYFPRKDSNVGVYTNSKGGVSYVIDGRVVVENGKLYGVSTNQEALEAYISRKVEGERTSFAKILSEKQWKIEEMEKAIENNETIIKAITWIGNCKYIKFPEHIDGFPINVIWGADAEFDWETVLTLSAEVRNQIRVSSLAQNGINASAGRLLADGSYGEPKPFFGTKAKFDISANQLVKNFRSFKQNKERCLVVLAEILQPNTTNPLNGLGNCLASSQAYHEYKSQLTHELATEKKILNPAHKIFVQAGDKEVIRVKGATSIIDVKATLADGTEEKKVVVLPPREYSAKGSLDKKLEPFVTLASFRDNELLQVEIEVNFNGTIIKQTVPALYCNIYEDAYHSAVYSLRLKPQNIFYYGAIFEMYRKNGWDRMATAISIMLDNQLVSQAMNFSDIEKMIFEEVKPEDIFK